MQSISIAKDFSRFPGGRYRSKGKYSGEEFRDDTLVPALSGGDQVQVSVDGTDGYGSSFLEEAFGGLVRKGFPVDDLRLRLKIVAEFPENTDYVEEIWSYIRDASLREGAVA